MTQQELEDALAAAPEYVAPADPDDDLTTRLEGVLAMSNPTPKDVVSALLGMDADAVGRVAAAAKRET